MIYIAGKISGLPLPVAEEKFLKTEKELRKLGLKVINPMDMGITHWTYEQQLEKCLEVIRIHATAIFLHRDWKDSDGAKREFKLVGDINLRRGKHERIEIYFEHPNGMREVTSDVLAGELNKSLIPES